jgi:hypothetical protein
MAEQKTRTFTQLAWCQVTNLQVIDQAEPSRVLVSHRVTFPRVNVADLHVSDNVQAAFIQKKKFS